MSASRFKSLLLSFLILFSSGCLGEDSQLDDGCDTRFLDSELEGVWEQHRHEDLSNRSIEYYEDGSKSPSSLDPDFSDLEYCWNVSYNTLSEEYQVDSGSADMGLVDVEILSFYHIDGELLFLATQHMTQSTDTMMRHINKLRFRKQAFSKFYLLFHFVDLIFIDFYVFK